MVYKLGLLDFFSDQINSIYKKFKGKGKHGVLGTWKEAQSIWSTECESKWGKVSLGR